MHVCGQFCHILRFEMIVAIFKLSLMYLEISINSVYEQLVSHKSCIFRLTKTSEWL